jgi:DNA-directed RNA polymerase III subunit RPC2
MHGAVTLSSIVRDDVNIVIAMKAMGAESDQEIIQMVGEEEELSMLLIPTIQDCKQKGVFTQGQALDYLGERGGST